MGNIKQINIKNSTYYFFNDMINIKKYDLNLPKIDKKSYKSIDIYFIRYITMKCISDYENINSVNSLYLIINKAGGCIEERNESKCSVFASTDKNKEALAKHTKLWDVIKCLIKTIYVGEAGEYDKDFIKVKFNSADNFPLNKILQLHNLTVIVRSVFEEDGKYLPQDFLDVPKVFLEYERIVISEVIVINKTNA